MQRCLSSSLYWYVEKSLEDMLEGYMLHLKDESVGLNNETVSAKVNQLIMQMLDLPMEFDSTSLQLSVSLILDAIQRNIKSTKACMYLLVTMLKRSPEISGILKSDFLTLLEQILFREVKKDEYMKPEVPGKDLNSEKLGTSNKFSLLQDEDEEQVHPKVESRAYAEILVELYQKDFVSATQMLVYLEQLSKKEPSYYHTDLLLFLLSRIGTSVENRMSRGSYILRNSMPTPSSSFGCYNTASKTTFDGIFKRLDFLVPYAISTESQKAYKKITETRKAKSRSKAKKARSKDSLKNGRPTLLFQDKRKEDVPVSVPIPTSSESVQDTAPAAPLCTNPEEHVNNDEGITAL